MEEPFAETTNSIAQLVPCDACTVRLYADRGLIEHRRLPSGVRLFRASAVKEVRRIRATRLALRGGAQPRKAVTG